MHVKCPKCEQGFKVPDKALGAKGRKLKCSNCEHQWFQKPIPKRAAPKKEKPAAAEPVEEAAADEEPPAEAAAEAEPLDEGESAEAAEGDDEAIDPPPLGDVSGFRGFQARKAEKKSRPIALYVLVALAVLIPAGLLGARTSLVPAWPPSALLYDTIGLHVPVPGEDLVLQNVHVHRRQEGTVEVLVVAGEIRNPTETLVSLLSVRATILGADGTELTSWLIVPDTYQLLPDEKTPFTSEFSNSVPGAGQVHVTFTDERPAAGLGY